MSRPSCVDAAGRASARARGTRARTSTSGHSSAAYVTTHPSLSSDPVDRRRDPGAERLSAEHPPSGRHEGSNTAAVSLSSRFHDLFEQHRPPGEQKLYTRRLDVVAPVRGLSRNSAVSDNSDRSKGFLTGRPTQQNLQRLALDILVPFGAFPTWTDGQQSAPHAAVHDRTTRSGGARAAGQPARRAENSASARPSSVTGGSS